MVALEIPDDANGPQVIGATQIEDLLDDLRSRTKLEIDRAGLLIDQTLIPTRSPNLRMRLARAPCERGASATRTASELPE